MDNRLGAWHLKRCEYKQITGTSGLRSLLGHDVEGTVEVVHGICSIEAP